jgi:hypothetical protein
LTYHLEEYDIKSVGIIMNENQYMIEKNGKDDIPYMKWKIKVMFQTTNQHHDFPMSQLICPMNNGKSWQVGNWSTTEDFLQFGSESKPYPKGPG